MNTYKVKTPYNYKLVISAMLEKLENGEIRAINLQAVGDNSTFFERIRSDAFYFISRVFPESYTTDNMVVGLFYWTWLELDVVIYKNGSVEFMLLEYKLEDPTGEYHLKN